MSDAEESLTPDHADKFTMAPSGTVMTQCVYCVHDASGPFANVCKAFPGGIPGEILSNELDHRKPYPGGQEDTALFTPRDDLPPEVLRNITAALDAIPD